MVAMVASSSCGDYAFVSYFECAAADVPVFHEVCDALHD